MTSIVILIVGKSLSQNQVNICLDVYHSTRERFGMGTLGFDVREGGSQRDGLSK